MFVTPEIRALAEAIPNRHTSRRPYGSTHIPERVLDDLGAAAHAEGGSLVVVDPVTREAVLSLVRTAEVRQRSSRRYRAELAKWTVATPGRDDGVPPEAFGPRPELAAIPVRDFDPEHVTNRRVARYEREPNVAVLFTSEDGRADWLRAGQALEHVLLTATVHGLVAAPLTQAMELVGLREIVSASQYPQVAQLVLRLGYAGRARQTPRRPVADVLVPPTI
jgi:hypothetical protein